MYVEKPYIRYMCYTTLYNLTCHTKIHIGCRKILTTKLFRSTVGCQRNSQVFPIFNRELAWKQLTSYAPLLGWSHPFTPLSLPHDKHIKLCNQESNNNCHISGGPGFNSWWLLFFFFYFKLPCQLNKINEKSGYPQLVGARSIAFLGPCSAATCKT